MNLFEGFKYLRETSEFKRVPIETMTKFVTNLKQDEMEIFEEFEIWWELLYSPQESAMELSDNLFEFRFYKNDKNIISEFQNAYRKYINTIQLKESKFKVDYRLPNYDMKNLQFELYVYEIEED